MNRYASEKEKEAIQKEHDKSKIFKVINYKNANDLDSLFVYKEKNEIINEENGSQNNQKFDDISLFLSDEEDTLKPQNRIFPYLQYFVEKELPKHQFIIVDPFNKTYNPAR